ncbi:MAG TPA: glycoside hydrolase family 9 protein [Polyangiaceae bacterium]|jgi:endoglucanase|nr:glycoside hydrolase family 9 protein [Polyangiaceae bacterium]
MPGVNVPAIKVDTVGYPSAWRKIAIFNLDPQGARVVDEAGNVAYRFRPEDLEDRGTDESSRDRVFQADFSALVKPGRYAIEVGTAKSDRFVIGKAVYGTALKASLKHFYLQRCRTTLDKPYAEWEGKAYTRALPCHVHEDVGWDYGSYPEKKKKWHMVQGWHDAGNFDMYIPSTGPTAQSLLIAYESHPDLFKEDSNIPESHNGVPDILDEARWGISWILSMQDLDTGGFHARVAVFGHSDPDPVKERKPQWVAGVGTASTAKATAVLAQAARVYKKFDAPFAARCERAARTGFAFLEQHPERVLVDGKNSDQPLWDDSTEYKEIGARFSAAVEVYRSFRLPAALARVRSLLPDPETQPAKFVEGGWPNLSRFGFMGLVSDPGAPADLRAEAKARILAAVETQRPQIEKDGYLCATTPQGYYWGANSNLLEKAHEMAFALRLDPSRAWLREAARDQWHWILGRNPNGYSMVTRVGKGPDRIYSMEWGHESPPVPGYLIGGPNFSEFGFLAPNAPAKALLWDNPLPLSSGLPAHSLWHWEQSDLWDGGFVPKDKWDNGWWAVTEPDIYYNATLVLVASEMQFE